MISIIIPVYKTEHYLPQCLDSLLAQSYSDWEAILVDDGSPDGSGSICDAYAAKDSRFKAIHQENAGPGAARNRGLKEIKGEFFCFIDSDDWVAPDYLKQIMAPELERFDVVFWGYTEVQGDKILKIRTAPSVLGIDDMVDGDVVQDKSLQVIEKLIAEKLFGYTVCGRFKRFFVDIFELEFPTDIHIHEDLIFTCDYCQGISSACSIPLTEYYYRVPENQSLSHNRYYPVEECLLVANRLLNATEEWVRMNSRLAEYAIYTYLSKLNLAVMNCFDPLEPKKRTFKEKLNLVRFVQSEVRFNYKSYPSISGFSHKIYNYLNAHLICCYQLLYRYIR